MSNQTIVQKADLAVADLIGTGGYLNPMQADTFIRMMLEQPTLLSRIRTVPMNGPRMEINKIGMTSRILRAAPASGTQLADGDRAKPTTDQVTLTTKELLAEVHIPYDVLEDNIERGRLEDTIMSLISERASLDLEELILLGDTGSADPFLAQVDGVLEQCTTHVIDHTAAPVVVTKTIFKEGIKSMPNKYIRNKSDMAFFVSPDCETEYADSLANRETQLGDSKIITRPNEIAFGIPVVPVALMPNTQYVLTYPKNVILGVQRQISIETDKDIRKRILIVVLTMRVDVKFEEEDAAVKMLGIDTTP